MIGFLSHLSTLIIRILRFKSIIVIITCYVLTERCYGLAMAGYAMTEN